MGSCKEQTNKQKTKLKKRLHQIKMHTTQDSVQIINSALTVIFKKKFYRNSSCYD